MCYVRIGGTAKPECNTVQSRCDDRRRAVLSQRRHGDRGGTRRWRSEHHRAGADSGAARKARPRSRRPPAPPLRRPSRSPTHCPRFRSRPAGRGRRLRCELHLPGRWPLPAAGPAGSDEPGGIGQHQPAARTDPLSGHQYRHHAAAGADPQHAADRQRHPAGDHPGAERHHHRAGPAVHPRHHLQRRRRRPARRRSDHPRLRRARRPVP